MCNFVDYQLSQLVHYAWKVACVGLRSYWRLMNEPHVDAPSYVAAAGP
jgi:hypothetical protein